jgi:hypothetical protein
VSATEKHFTVQEVAVLWKLSDDTIIRKFENQPGVLRIGNEERRFKRKKITLRIPESVLIRVHEANRIKN